MSWSEKFDDPVPLADGGELVTLMDAGKFIQALPKAEQQQPHWQLATEILIAVAERRDLTLHARIAIIRALNAAQPAPAPSRKAKARKVTIVR